MKISFAKAHLSLKEPFDDIEELPDFMVLTGKNGSGKTHFLRAIESGSVLVNELLVSEINYFDYSSFTSQNYQVEANAGNATSDARAAYSHYTTNIHPTLVSLEENLTPDTIKDIRKGFSSKSVGVLELTEGDFSDSKNWENYENFRGQFLAFFRNDNNKGNEHSQAILSSIFHDTAVLPGSLSERKFSQRYRKIRFNNNPQLANLSEIYLQYFRKLKTNRLYEIESDSRYLSQQDFLKEYGPPPWEFIQEAFEKLGLHIHISNPIDDNIEFDAATYNIKFTNLERNGIEVGFNDLSSGEKILITLVNTVFTAHKDRTFPKLLLLDEIDSPLNPSIVGSFVEILKEKFVEERGLRIIVATHSPSVVVFSPPGSIYRVDTASKYPLLETTSSLAVSLLSEGFITGPDILSFTGFESIDVLIVSEGENYKHINHAKQFFPDTDKVKAIGFAKDLGGSSLRNIFKFFSVFNGHRKIVFVWDSDELQTHDFTYEKANANPWNKAFVFKSYTDAATKKGIENMYSRTFVRSYLQGGGSISNKKRFVKYVERNAKSRNCSRFKELFEFANKRSPHHNL